MPYEFINYEKKGRIAYVTINRPERLNALHPPANQELSTDFGLTDDRVGRRATSGRLRDQ